MREITAPNHPTNYEYDGFWPTLFVAGGIFGTLNWQSEYLEMLKDIDGLAFNPRRPKFDVVGQTVENEQISWEARYLAFANAASFWFPKETECPITLYELGRWTPVQVVGVDDDDNSSPIIAKKRLFIGVHPEYPRRVDVEIQTRLARPRLKIVYSLEDLAKQVRAWATSAGNEPREMPEFNGQKITQGWASIANLNVP